MSESEINDLDLLNDPAGSGKIIKSQLDKFSKEKVNEVEGALQDDAVPGLGASIFGLAFAAF